MFVVQVQDAQEKDAERGYHTSPFVLIAAGLSALNIWGRSGELKVSTSSNLSGAQNLEAVAPGQRPAERNRAIAIAVAMRRERKVFRLIFGEDDILALEPARLSTVAF